MNPLTQEQINKIKTFTPEQKSIYNQNRSAGIPPQDALDIVLTTGKIQSGEIKGRTPSDGILIGEKSLASGISGGIKEIITGGIRQTGEIAQQYGVGEAIQRLPLSLVAGAGRGVGEMFGAVFETVDDLTGETVSGAVQPLIEQAVASPTGQKVIQGIQRFDESTQGVAGDLLDASNLLGIGLLKSAPAKALRESIINKTKTGIIKPITEVKPTEKLRDLFKTKKVEEVIEKKADDILDTKVAREIAETTAPKVSVSEKAIGLTPDIKRRITGKNAKMQEYINVSKARNVDDTLPTAYEFGSGQANKAVTEMENLLNQTGGQIGKTREKLGTYRATIDDMTSVENTIDNQLAKLNLEIKDGSVVQKAGTVKMSGDGDIRALQEIYNNFRTVKQSPTLTNLIDFRTSVDSLINFGKTAREVSNNIDPLARQIRKDIADTSAKLVGKQEAGELAKYSDFMDAYKDLKSFTDRKAGGEYLLRLVLSGRGGEARKLIQTIKEYTGMDLMDDATMMTLVTDLLGNQSQKNLFRQEITKAGLDATKILKGDVGGVLGSVLEKAGDLIFDPEKILLEASR